MASPANQVKIPRDDSSSSQELKIRFRFLDLPAEIRNHIYRYLLVTKYVTERRINRRFLAFTNGDLSHNCERLNWPFTCYSLCQNVYIETRSYTPSILRVSHRVHQECSTIFSENFWIFVSVNKVSFFNDLKQHGFSPVEINKRQGRKLSVLVLEIQLPPVYRHSINSKSGGFLMNILDAEKLQRALFTSVMLRETELTFIDAGAFPEEPNFVTEAFSRLRGLCKATVCGPGSQYSLGTMARTISTPLYGDDVIMDAILERLQYSLAKIQFWQFKKNWHELASECETSIAFIIDCHVVHECLNISPAHNAVADEPVDKTKHEAIIDLYRCFLVLVVEAKFRIRDYWAVYHYCKGALETYEAKDPESVGNVQRLHDQAIAELEALGEW